jgi:aspartate/methionine/tyrosine aminotransferase
MNRRFIDLSLGDPCYGPPPEARVAATQAVLRPRSGYLPEAGLPDLRQALAAKLRDANGIDAEEDEVVVTTGGSLGLLASAAATAVPGDRVLIPRPGYPHYRLMAETLGLDPVTYPLLAERGYEPDWEALDTLAGDARLLIWNFPSNPTGAVADPSWGERLRALLVRHPQVLLISDEVYEDIVFEGSHVGAAALLGDLRDRCLSVFSFSKGLGMSGMRVGYVHAPGELGRRVARRQWSVAMSPPTPAQWAALAALRASGGYRTEVRELLETNRGLAQPCLSDLGLRCAAPRGGFFLWIETASAAMPAPELVEACERECAVRMSAGTSFDPTAEDRVRLSFAVPTEDLVEALDRIGAWIARTSHASDQAQPPLRHVSR